MKKEVQNQNEERNLRIELGIKDAGTYYYDLKTVPHLFVSGGEGTGKTSFVKALLINLMKQNNPDDIQFVICSSSEMEYAKFISSPFLIENPITDIYDIKYCLQALTDLIEYRLKNNVFVKNTPGNNDIFVILDDCVTITKYDWADKLLSKIILDGRVANVHLILVTSTPQGSAIPSEIRDGLPCRIAFCTASNSISKVVIGRSGAEKLKIPGQMIFKTPGDFETLYSKHYLPEEFENILDILKSTNSNTPTPTAVKFESLKKNRESEVINPIKNDTWGSLSRNNFQSNDLIHSQKEEYKDGLTSQHTLKGSSLKIQVIDNEVVIRKKLPDAKMAQVKIEKDAIRQLHHHKPGFFFKGYIGIQIVNEKQLKITCSNRSTSDRKIAMDVFGEELKNNYFVIKYADKKEPKFLKFIRALARDLHMKVIED